MVESTDEEIVLESSDPIILEVLLQELEDPAIETMLTLPPTLVWLLQIIPISSMKKV